MNKQFELNITKLALGGYGLGHAEGKAVFVPCTTVGDHVEVELHSEKKNVAFARVTRFLERGRGVVPVACDAFPTDVPCGGCDWLMLDYHTQLEYKTELIRELLQPLAPKIRIRDTIASPTPIHYRNKSFMPVGKDAEGLTYGMFARGSHQIVAHQSCALHPPIFDTIARRCLEIFAQSGVEPYDETTHSGNLRHIGFRCSQDQQRILLILVTRSSKLAFTKLLVKQLTAEFPNLTGIIQNINRDRGNVILGAADKLLFGTPYLTDQLSGLLFRIHYRSFWQINSSTLSLITETLRSFLSPQDTVFDAYAGIGSLGLPLASSVSQVLCIEESKDAVADGEENARLNGISNAGFLCARVEDALPTLLQTATDGATSAPDVIILDPPRSGILPDALYAIVKARIPRIFYLSCSPITLHRDLKLFLDSGLYKLQYVQPFDMFPQTWHIETLAILELREAIPTGN